VNLDPDHRAFSGGVMEEKQYIVDALSSDESWRVFRIMAEFVDAIEELSKIGHAVSIFGRPEMPPVIYITRKPVRLPVSSARRALA